MMETKNAIKRWKEMGVKVLNKAPNNYRINKLATTAPLGYDWHTNGKSRFKPGYKTLLVKSK